MAKHSGASAFDEILQGFTADEDKQAFTGLAERYPQLKDYGLRQSDYSRSMNENREKLEKLEEWNTWKEQFWDSDSKMTKAEKQMQIELEEARTERTRLEQAIATGNFGGQDMDFAQIENDLDGFLKKRGIVDKDTLTAKEAEFKALTGAQQYASLTVPYLNLKHNKEFGEPFNPTEFVTQATEKGRFDLEEFYENSYVLGKRQAKVEADHKAELERIKAESELAVAQAKKDTEQLMERMKGMGPGSGPTDDVGTEMGSFQRGYLKLDQAIPEGANVPEGVELGDHSIAKIAAREYFKNKMTGKQ